MAGNMEKKWAIIIEQRERQVVAGEGESRVAEAVTRVPRGSRRGKGARGSARGAHR